MMRSLYFSKVPAFAVILFGVLAVYSPAHASGRSPTDAFPITGAYSATQTAERDHISIIEIAGNYDRDLGDGSFNSEPRAVIAREFYRTHPDNYDFLVAFSTFEFDTGDAIAFHAGVQNKVKGIGLPQYDNTQLFGSQGRLQGFIDMAALSRYKTDPLDPAFEKVMMILSHEVLHQWSAFVKFKMPDGSASDALIGKDDAHWSYLLDSDSSVEYGADWRDNGDGTFTSIGQRKFFSPLDLYLMGFYKPEEVPPMVLIDNSGIDKTQLPQDNVTINGTKRVVTIEDIIAQEGPRVPDADNSQKTFRMAFVLLTAPGEQVSDAQIAGLNRIRNAFMTRFAILTGGRAIAEVYPEAMPVEEVGAPGTIEGGETRAASASLNDGLSWLRGKQSSEGYWEDKPVTAPRDTMTALSTLRLLDTSFNNTASAIQWLNNNPSGNVDYLARQAAVFSDMGSNTSTIRSKLLAMQNPDGGWGIAEDYRSDPLDTALGVLALNGHGSETQFALDRAAAYLIDTQNSDGGWGSTEGGPSRVTVTTTVHEAALSLSMDEAVTTRALQWLASKQNTDGGFGDEGSTVHDTARTLQTFIAVDSVVAIRGEDAAGFLLARQDVEGSWEGSVYATASAIAALKRYSFPNWALTSFDATPLTPMDGQRVELAVTVKNDSNVADPAGILRLYDGDPAAGGNTIGPDIQIPPLVPGAILKFSPLWDTLDKQGDHVLYAVVDPDDVQAEMGERDNTVSVGVKVEPAPAGVDLIVSNVDMMVAPSNPNILPTSLGSSASVRNAGLTDAMNVRVELWEGTPGEGTLVGETTLDFQARSSVAVNFSHILSRPGDTTFTVVVDPDNAIVEASDSNNSASATISTEPSVDLEVADSDLSADKSTVYLGEDVTFHITMRNRGTVDANGTKVRFLITNGSTTEEIRTDSFDLNAGSSVERTITWRSGLTGDLVFSVHLDPDGLLPESEEGNNAASLHLTGATASGPNLAVSYKDLTFAPSPGLEGSDVVISAVVRNTGTVPVTDAEVVFYNRDPAQGGVAIGSSTIPSIDVGASASVTVTWPAIPTSGDKILYVVADPGNAVAEFNEDDNSAFIVLPVMSLPDLAIAAGDLALTPAFPKSGDTVQLSVRVMNLGQLPATSIVVRAFYGDPAAGGVAVGGDQVITELSANEEASVEFEWVLGETGGVKPIVVQVDPDGTIVERYKSNNLVRRDLAVQDGSLYVTNPYFSPNGDEVKDTTQLFFRLATVADVSVEVRDGSEKVVRRITASRLQQVSDGNVIWDGLDDLGRLVRDGRYRMRVVDAAGASLGDIAVTVDTNRSSLLASLGTKYGAFTNLTCALPDIRSFQMTNDDEQVYLSLQNGNAAYIGGLYRMAGDGSDIRPVVEKTDKTLVQQISADPNGEMIAFVQYDWNARQNFLWVTDSEGKSRRNLGTVSYSAPIAMRPDMSGVLTSTYSTIIEYPTNGDPARVVYQVAGSDSFISTTVSYSPDGKTAAIYGRYKSAYVAYLVDIETGAAVTVPGNWSGVKPSWSVDGSRVAILNDRDMFIGVYDVKGSLIRQFDIPLEEPRGFWTDVGDIHWSTTGSEFAFSAATFCECSGEELAAIEDFGGIFVADVSRGALEEVVRFSSPSESSIPASYHISVWDGQGWVERGVLHYGMHYTQKELDLTPFLPQNGSGEVRVKIRQTGMEAAHVEMVALSVGGQLFAPAYAKHLGTGEDALDTILHRDNEVLDLHETEMELRWDKIMPGETRLLLRAREELLSTRNAIPFTYPAGGDGVYKHVIDDGKPMLVDGNQTAQDNLSKPLFNVYSKPGTGHPAADVYGYVQSDDAYLYGALDFTVDNTQDDNKDWAAMRVHTPSGWKAFKIKADYRVNGEVGFIHTGKVHHIHKYYEFKIPLSEIGVKSGDEVDIQFQAYGTAAIIEGSTDGNLSPFGEVVWVPWERALLYRSEEFDGTHVTAIFLDEKNRQQQVFEEWGDDFFDQMFSPTGRQLLFKSNRAVSDPSGPCYANSWNGDYWSYRSILNLTADLRAVRTAAGEIKIQGTAADLNFSNYLLEYTEASSPENWKPIQPSSSDQAIDEVLGRWIPPGPGTYLLRLTSYDLAGNARQRVIRVSWADTPSLTDLYRTPTYISPNGDGVQDSATIHYRTLAPVHLDFTFFNTKGDRVRTISRDHGVIGAEFGLVWDGRNDSGLPVADGLYRLKVQDFTLYITVDSTPPVTTLALWDAYQYEDIKEATNNAGGSITKRYVKFEPRLGWSVIDANYKDMDIQVGRGVLPSTWSSVYDPDPQQADGELQEWNMGELSFAGNSFRALTNDLAGNSDEVSVEPGREQLIVTAFGDLALHPNIDELLADGVNPNDVRSLADPISRVLYDEIEEVTATISNGRDAFIQISETIVTNVIGLEIHYREVGAETWQSMPISQYVTRVDSQLDSRLALAPDAVLGSGVKYEFVRTTDIANGVMNAVWPTSTLNGNTDYVVKLRAVDAIGHEHYSNAFRINTRGGVVFNGLVPDDEKTPPYDDYSLWGTNTLSGAFSRADLYVYSNDDPRYLVARRIASVTSPGVRLEFRTKELSACAEYNGYIVLVGEPDGEGNRAEISRSPESSFNTPCIGIESIGGSGPVHYVEADECGAASPNRVEFRLVPVNYDRVTENGDVLKLLTLWRESDESSSEDDVVFNVNKPKSGELYTYTFDTSMEPEGVVYFGARIIDVNDNAVSYRYSVVVDHTPPSVSIDYPSEGQRVCGTVLGNDYSIVSLEGSISDAEVYVQDESASLNKVTYKHTLYGTPPEFFEKPVERLGNKDFYGPVGIVSGASGTVSANLQVVDRGGFRQCAVRTFDVDALVEATVPSLDRSVFSPNGDGTSDQVTLTYGSAEAVKATVTVHPASLDEKGRFTLDPASVRTLISDYQILADEATAAWDGLDDSAGRAADGWYGLRVVLTDACGNEKEDVRYVSVDNTPPSIQVDYPKYGDPLRTIVEIQGAINDLHLSDYRVSYDDGSVIIASGSRPPGNTLGVWNTFGLEGSHILQVAANDSAGNHTEVDIPVLFQERTNIVSYLEAVPTLFSPLSDSRQDTAAIRIGLEQDAIVNLSLSDSGGSVYRTLVSDTIMTKGAMTVGWDGRDDSGMVLADGTYTVQLRTALADNAAVKQEEETSITVDTTPPSITVSRPVGGFVAPVGGVVANIVDQHLDTYSLQITDSPNTPNWKEFDSGVGSDERTIFGSLDELVEGDYAIRVDAIDGAGNKANVIVPFTIDATPPAVEFTAPLPDTFLSGNAEPVEIKGSINEIHLDHYTLESGQGIVPASWSELAGAESVPSSDLMYHLDVSNLEEGAYTLRLKAVDKAGLSVEKRLVVTVDNTLPEAVITSPVAGGYVRGPIDILGTANDDNIREYALDVSDGDGATESPWSPVGKGTVPVRDSMLSSLQALPPDGQHDLRLTVHDKAGNSAETVVAVIVDTHAPQAPVGLASVVEDQNNVHLFWQPNAESDVVGYSVYRDGVRITDDPVDTAEYVDISLADGNYKYTVTAWDAAGWESKHSTVVDVVVDTLAPVVKISAPANAGTVNTIQDVRGTAHSTDDFKEYRLYVAPANEPMVQQLLRQSPVPVLGDVLSQWNTLGLQEGGEYFLTLEGEDINGNTAMDQIRVTVDNLAPSIPKGLVASVDGANVQLTWDVNADTDLYGYLIFRDGKIANAIGTVVGDLKSYVLVDTQYPDLALPDGRFIYTLIAIDHAGNVSGESMPVEVSIDTHAPQAVIDTPENGAKFDTALYIRASSPDKDIDGVLFQYRAEGAVEWLDIGPKDSVLPYEASLDPITSGLLLGVYELRAVATDLSANLDPAPNSILVEYTDITAPVPVVGLSSHADGGDVALHWSANSEPDLAGYYVERIEDDGSVSRLTSIPISDVNYVDSGLADGMYQYSVVAVDTSTNEAGASNRIAAVVYTPTLDQPFTPTRAKTVNLNGRGITASVLSGEVVTGSGTAMLPGVPTEQDGSFVLNGIALVEGVNTFTLRLTDLEGNVSKPKTLVVAMGEAPSQPTGLGVTENGYNVEMGWNANPETDIIGYRPFRDDIALLPDAPIGDASALASSSAALPSSVIDLNEATYWSPLIDSQNPTGEGEWIEVSWTQPRVLSHVDIFWWNKDYRAVDFDIEAWSGAAWVGLGEFRGNDVVDNSITLEQPYRTTRFRILLKRINLPFSYYRPVRLSEIGLHYQPLEESTVFTDVAPDGAFAYRVSAVNAYGYESVVSDPIALSVGDVQAPDPVVLGASVSGSDVSLSWSASASSDVARYVLYRDGTLIATHTDLASLRYIDTNRPNGDYLYTAVAIDAANNESVPSNQATATVAMPLPPSPLNLTLSAIPEGGALELSWQPATGSLSTRYRVLRAITSGGPYEAVADTTELSTRDIGLNNGQTYFYVVVGVDTLGNESAYSNEESGTPSDSIAPELALHYPTIPGRLFVTTKDYATLVGTADPGSAITLYQDAVEVGHVVASPDKAIQLANQIELEVTLPQLSPDGRYAVFVKGNDLSLYDFDTNTTVVLTTLLAPDYQEPVPQWSWNGDSITFIDTVDDYGDYYSYARIYSLKDKTLKDITDPWQDDAWRSLPAPDGLHYAVYGPLYSLSVDDWMVGIWNVDLASGERVLVVDDTAEDIDAMTMRWSPDGKYLAYLRTSPSMKLEIVNVSTGTVQTIDTQAGESAPSWSPDGQSLAYASWRSGGSQIWTYNIVEATSRLLTVGSDEYYAPVWSSDGRTIVAARNGSDVIQLNLDGSPLEMLFTSGSDVISECMQGVPSAYVGVCTDDGLMNRIDLPGRFSLAGLILHGGDNVFDAIATDENGNQSQPSGTVIIDYRLDGLSDLAISKDDVRILPAVPRSGESTRVSATVHNLGAIASSAVDVSLVVVDPQGGNTILNSTNTLGVLQPGEYQTIAADWTAGSVPGTYTLLAIVDPSDDLAEASEANNLAIAEIFVASEAMPQLGIATNRTVYSAGESASVTVNVSNAGDTFNGRLDIAIEDLAGYTVQTILVKDVVALGYAQDISVSAIWDSGTTFAGTYQARARLYGHEGNLISDRTTVFELGASSALRGEVFVDRSVYFANDDVHVSANIKYDSGNTLISGATGVIRILDGSGSVLAETAKALGELYPGMNFNLALDWNTGTLPVGSYVASLSVMQGNNVLAGATALIEVDAGAAELNGNLTLSEAAPGLGTPQNAVYVVTNVGNVDLVQLPIRISLQRAGVLTPIATESVLSDMAVGESQSRSVIFPTAGLALGNYTVLLQAEVADHTGVSHLETLQSAGFVLVDRTPPTVNVHQPDDGGYLRGEAPVTVFAMDAISSIKTVEISVDGGAWKAIPVRNPVEGLWGAVLIGLSEGTHTVKARATDASGNMAESVLNAFVVDNTPPDIAVGGVADGRYYNAPVVPTIDVTEAALASGSTTLNGTPYVTGSTIDSDGDYVLVAWAMDMAGNESTKRIEFHVDSTPPVITIEGVTDGAAYNTDVTPVITVNENNVQSFRVLLNGLDYSSGTPVTVDGNYVLSVEVTDFAGNQIQATVGFSIDKVAPTVDFNSPQDGATLIENTVDVSGTTEPDALVYVTTLGGFGVEILANAQGGFSVIDIPLVDGSNTITAYARDSAGNVGAEIRITVSVNTRPVELQGVLKHGGRVLVWLPGAEKGCGKAKRHERERRFGWKHHNGHCDKTEHDAGHDRDEKRGGESSACVREKDGGYQCEGGQVAQGGDGHQQNQTVDDPYAVLGAMIEATLMLNGADYLIVRTEDDFVEAMRTRRYTTLVIGELAHSEGKASSDQHDRKGGENDFDHFVLHMQKQTAREIDAAVRSGFGVLWIKNTPDNNEHLADVFGAKIKGKLSKLTEIVVSDTEVMVDGSWRTDGDGLKLEAEDGVLVGHLTSGKKSYPALVRNEYGAGRAVLMPFDPASFEDAQGGMVLLKGILDFLAPSHLPLVPGAYVELTWTASKMSPPIDIELHQVLPDGMQHVAVLDGSLVSDMEAKWVRHVQDEVTSFSSLIRLASVMGTYDIMADLFNSSGDDYTLLKSQAMQITVLANRETLGAELLSELDELSVKHNDRERLRDAEHLIRDALNRTQINSEDAEHAINRLSNAYVQMEKLSVDTDSFLIKLGVLIGTYEQLWSPAH